MSKTRIEDGFTYEMTKSEVEEKFYGEVACEFGTPRPHGLWESLFVAPVYPEQVRKEYLSNHCYSPLIRQLIQDSMKEGE